MTPDYADHTASSHELKNTQAHISGDRRPLTYVPAPPRL